MVLLEKRVYDVRDSIEKARKAVLRNPVVFDTETTGLDSKAEVIEISCVSLDGTVLLDSLVRPRYSIPGSATAIHGLRDQDVADSPTIFDLLPQIDDIFQSEWVSSYNLDFDLRVLRQSLLQYGVTRTPHQKLTFTESLFETHWGYGVCIMDLYARWVGEWSDYYGSYKFQRLDRAAERLEVSFPEPRHRALSDAQAARGVLLAMSSLDI